MSNIHVIEGKGLYIARTTSAALRPRQSVTAPLLALDTAFINFANAPRV